VSGDPDSFGTTFLVPVSSEGKAKIVISAVNNTTSVTIKPPTGSHKAVTLNLLKHTTFTFLTPDSQTHNWPSFDGVSTANLKGLDNNCTAYSTRCIREQNKV